jgi:hypothetical protein
MSSLLLGEGIQRKGQESKVKNTMILLSKNERIEREQDSKKLCGVHRHTVEDRINQFNSTGVEGPKDIPPPRRPPKITEEEKEIMFKIALGKPNELGLPYSSWLAQLID